MRNLKILESKKQILIAYMRDKIDDQDWHGVADAANDLRELEVEIRMLKELNRKDSK